MCTKEKIIINSKVLYGELCKMAETRMKKEKDTLMKIFSNIENETWPSPYFKLKDDLEESEKSREKKLCALAHLKAHIDSKKTRNEWTWQIINIVASLVALLISLAALYNTSLSPDKLTTQVNTSSSSSNEKTVEANTSSSSDEKTIEANASLSSGKVTIEVNASSSPDKIEVVINTFSSLLKNINIGAVVCVVCILIAIFATVIGVFVRPKQCGINQYVLSIVESLESYYLDPENDQQAKDAKEGQSVSHTDKT